MTKETQLALGRLFKIMSRPFKEGDEKEYFRCRDIVMANSPSFTDYTPCWILDRNKGAAGD